MPCVHPPPFWQGSEAHSSMSVTTYNLSNYTESWSQRVKIVLFIGRNKLIFNTRHPVKYPSSHFISAGLINQLTPQIFHKFSHRSYSVMCFTCFDYLYPDLETKKRNVFEINIMKTTHLSDRIDRHIHWHNHILVHWRGQHKSHHSDRDSPSRTHWYLKYSNRVKSY